MMRRLLPRIDLCRHYGCTIDLADTRGWSLQFDWLDVSVALTVGRYSQAHSIGPNND